MMCTNLVNDVLPKLVQTLMLFNSPLAQNGQLLELCAESMLTTRTWGGANLNTQMERLSYL